MSQVVHMLLHFRQDMADVSGRTVAELVDAPACPDPKSAARCGRHRQYVGLCCCCRLHIFLHQWFGVSLEKHSLAAGRGCLLAVF